MRAPLPRGWRDEVMPHDVCPVLALSSASGAAAPNWRKARYYRRRSAQRGEIALARADAESFDEIFAALLRLHAWRWGERGLPGVLAATRERDFHCAAARALLGQGVLRLYALRLAGRIVAALYAFHAHGRTYSYLGGFDPDVAELGPGTQIVAYGIEEARREGALHFDFLRGQEAHKYRWGAVDRPNSLRRLYFADAR